MREPRSIVVEPLQTEKSMGSMGRSRAYSFVVRKDANKIEIRNAIQSIYNGVKVSHVRTMLVKGKSRRFKARLGYQNDWKKAIVTLKEESKPIEGF
ncbi:MAG: large subunit ribosomal protein [Planctomycetota bacterium]|nr:MAG: large subunit ribosomal protein [Planctomycetota bacterium]